MTVSALARTAEPSLNDAACSGSPARVATASPLSPLAQARGLARLGCPDGALRILEAELSAGRESPELLRLMGRVALQVADHALAQRALERAMEIAPDDVVIQVRLARVLLRAGEASAAGG